MASKIRRDISDLTVNVPTRYLDQENIRAMFTFPKDIKTDQIKLSSLNEPNVLKYYLEGWKYWN